MKKGWNNEPYRHSMAQKGIKTKSNIQNQKVGYNSHGYSMLFSDFIKVEITERNNYSIQEINKWIKKYNINEKSRVIWITFNPIEAYLYNLSSEEKEMYETGELKINKNEIDVKQISLQNGFIIIESHDGDGGYLFVYR